MILDVAAACSCKVSSEGACSTNVLCIMGFVDVDGDVDVDAAAGEGVNVDVSF